MWRTRQPDPEQVRRLKQRREEFDLRPLVIHDSYLINLGSPPSETREKSIDAFRGELERALVIGADFLVAHPGSYKGIALEQGILNVADGLAKAWHATDSKLRTESKLTILLENTAGAGAQLGGRLEELAAIRQGAEPYLDIPIGYCLDTCHSFVSGVDLATKRGFARFMAEADAVLGLNNVPVFHANDAKMPLNSHCDRHAAIGAGYIGLEGFRRLLNHPELQDKAFILETPVDEPGDDLRNVKALKELLSQNKRSTLRKLSPNGMLVGRKTRRST